jgi:K+/H+ antiporter YhaU regulatory subunit KhtT
MEKKLTQEEFQQINLIKSDALEVAALLGELEYQKMSIELDMEEQRKKIKEIRVKEKQVFEEIRSKYGQVSINTETGEIS